MVDFIFQPSLFALIDGFITKSLEDQNRPRVYFVWITKENKGLENVHPLSLFSFNVQITESKTEKMK